MEQTVYADIFFLINFSMDFLALFLAARLLERPMALARFVFAAAFGGIYACVALFLATNSIVGLLIDAFACVLMALIATFRRSEIKSSLIFSLVFSAVSILLGGVMTALFNVFNKIGFYKFFGEEAQSDGISVWLFAILAVISGIIALFGGRFFKRRSARKRGSVEIFYAGASVRLSCFCDSGNLLREPISQLPCVIVDTEAVGSIFPRSFLEAACFGDISRLSERERSRVRVIPATSAVGESVLVGIRVDSLRIDFGKGFTSVEAYVVPSREGLLANGIKAIVPSELAFGAA